MPFRAPVSDMEFLLEHVVDYAAVAATERFAEATPDMTAAILTEAGKVADTVMAPLQRNGDLHPARLENGVVITSPGFAEGFSAIAEGGWIGVSADPEFGGMGLPKTLNTAVFEMFAGANLALQLNPILTQGQVEALEAHASDAIKALYLPKLIGGEWSGTMNLTEPQAGSDVGALTTKATDNGDGTFAITGQKIFISWADSDFAENVCHLVLARLPDGPKGTKGISLFLVPKFIPDADGNPGKANSLRVARLEHKMGLHGSPTAEMVYDGATGWLVGAPHAGMAAMFTMMNAARLGVGAQGIGVAEAAFQMAREYASTRKQVKTIIEFADIRRMLSTMRADIFAARAIALNCAQALDMADATGDAAATARAAFLTPIAKAFGTEIGVKVSEDGIQVHGGMGFVEETGAAQFLRDVRVTAIYEGTNGIQALDLVGRKLADGGEAAFQLIDEVEDLSESLRTELPDLAGLVWEAAETLREATEWLLTQAPGERAGGAFPFLMAFARVLGAAAHLRAAHADPGGPRHRLAALYIKRLLPEHKSLLDEARAGDEDLFALTVEELLA